jgi:hypothetical protein
VLRPSKRFIPVLAAAFVLLNFDAAWACSLKWKGYRATMMSDLRNLVVAESEYLADHGRFTTSFDDMRYRVSTGVAGVTIEAIGDSSYVARATHTQLPEMACMLYVGRKPADPAFANAVEGEPLCTGNPPPSPYKTAQRVAVVSFFLVLTLTLTTLLFLRVKGRRNWPARGMVLASVASFLSVSSICGRAPAEFLAAMALIGIGLFGLSLRNRLALPRPA